MMKLLRELIGVLLMPRRLRTKRPEVPKIRSQAQAKVRSRTRSVQLTKMS